MTDKLSVSRQTLSFRALSLACVTAGLMPWAAHPFARGGQEIDVGPFEVVTDFPVHEELTAKETLPYLTAELSAVGANGQREVIRFSANRITIVAQKNADTDNDQSPRLHFDDEELIGASKDISSARVKIVSLLKEESPDIAQVVVALGSALHTIQDFYSHSNWVELGNVDIVRQLGDDIAPQVFKANDQIGPMCDFDPADLFDAFPFISLLAPPSGETSTGYWYGLNGIGQPVLSGMPPGKCPHGGFDPLSSGLNKDTDLRPRHAEARQLAKLASWNFVSKIIQDLEGNDAALCALMGDTTTGGCTAKEISPPPAPTGLSATPSDRSVQLAWNSVPAADQYTVYIATVPFPTGVEPSSISDAVELVAGASAVVSGLSNGVKYYFVVTGTNEVGEGPPSEQTAATPVRSPIPSPRLPHRTVSVNGEGGGCAVVQDGRVFCWGRRHPLGYDIPVPGSGGRAEPAPVAEIADAVEVLLASGSGCALLASGTVKCWGRLNSTNNGSIWPPFEVSGIRNAQSIALSSNKTLCAITADSTMFCWGNTTGFLPYSNLWLAEPLLLPSAKPIAGIAPSVPSAVLFNDGSLGFVRNYASASPYLVLPQYASDMNPRVVGFSDGIIWFEGGEVGGRAPVCLEWASYSPSTCTRYSTELYEIVPVEGLPTDAQTIRSQGDNCVVLTTGTVHCWGSPTQGALGTGTLTGAYTYFNSAEPKLPVVGISTAVALAEDGNQRCAILANQTVTCWGRYSGVSAFGGVANTATPVPVEGLIGVKLP